MEERTLDSRVRNTFYLIFSVIVYLVAIVAILRFFPNGQDSMILLFIALVPLILIFVMIWGYGLKFKIGGIEFDAYPVEKVMNPAYTIDANKTYRDAEELMEKHNTDFLNIIDKHRILKGILTKADLYKARRRGKLKNRIEKLGTKIDKVISAREQEGLKSIMEKIGHSKHSKLPVLDKDNKLKGIVDAVVIHELLSRVLK